MLSLQRVWVHPLVSGQGTKILQAVVCGQIKKKKKICRASQQDGDPGEL